MRDHVRIPAVTRTPQPAPVVGRFSTERESKPTLSKVEAVTKPAAARASPATSAASSGITLFGDFE